MDRTRFDVPYSDEWWFKRLFAELNKKEKRRNDKVMTRVQWFDYLWDWFLGQPPLPEHTTGWQAQVTKDVLKMGRANFARLAVESKLDRCKLQAFHTVDTSDDGDADGPPDPKSPEVLARRLMNRYSGAFAKALLYASVMREGYIQVGKPDPLTGLPIVTAEDPRQCVTINDPIDEDRTLAGLKLYRNDVDGYDYAHVGIAEPLTFTDDETGEETTVRERVRVARRKSTPQSLSIFNTNAWEWDDEKSAELPIQGRGIMLHRISAPLGTGDFETFLDLLARINNMIVDRLWIMKYQVFRQRALTAKENGETPEQAGLPTEDAEGNEIDYDEIFSADPGAMWELPVGYTIWESTPTEITGALTAVRDDIKEFAAVSRTPLYVFVPEAADGSAEGASLAREGQVYHAETWQTIASRPFLGVCADMLAVAGADLGSDGELELDWMPAERYSLLQRAQAAAAAKNAGVPWEGRMADFMQLSPETIARYKRFRRQDLLFEPEPATPAVNDRDAEPAAAG